MASADTTTTVDVPTVAPYHSDWKEGRLTSWLTTVDHKRIGILYLWTSLIFFAFGGLLALLIRTQLATPNETFMTGSAYNQAVTIHGTTMIFLVIVPILAGFGNFLVPLMIGAQDMAFPRLNALSYWLYVLGGLILVLSFEAKGGAAQAGWTSYATLSTLHSPGRGQDLWILSLHVLTLSSLAGAINFIVTISNMRARGMTWTRIPLFVWAIYTYAWLLVLALPSLSAGLTMMLTDRNFGTHFFDPAHGGSPILYQHVFWFFGHPEVYIMVLPAMGIVSEIIPVFARKPIFGYKAVALSTIGIAFLAFLVWGHHMFAVGLPTRVDSFFMISSMVIAVPTGVKIFNWLATLWRGNISFDTPMLWVLGFIGVFTIGGLSGIFLAAFPVDWQLTQTYFVVAHIHYVLFGGSMFAIFGGLYYWWPKIFGRLLDDRLGKLHFWLVFVGFNLAFFPQHLLGLLGMPRRIYTYHQGGLWETYNMLSTIGAFTMAVGMLVFVVNIVKTSRTGPRATNDPWIADTLEWYATSPPPPWNFDRVPYIISARPLRDLRRRLEQELRL
jgi:cytochrome c oxidase subunit I